MEVMEVIVKILKKEEKVRGEGGCVQRMEVIVKRKKKVSGGGGGGGGGGGVRVDVNEKVKLL